MTDDDARLATADLIRLAEPGDTVLAYVVDVLGAPAVRAAVAEGAFTADDSRRLEAEGKEDALDIAAWNLPAALRRWAARLGDCDAERDIRVMAKIGGRLVLPSDDEWPGHLGDLWLQAPLGLWVRGPAPLTEALEGSVAIVGARAASPYGTGIARDFAFRCVSEGRAVVSGGAFGIDAAAHAAALMARGPLGGRASTVAFMAGGVDRPYPRVHTDLLEDIARHGLLVSETAPGMAPMRHRFLQRNRLIAAASAATVVVEAGWRSGALNTAHHAVDLGRELGAVPGSIHSATSAGCHRLIRESGAVCVTSFDDVLGLVGPLSVPPAPEVPDRDGDGLDGAALAVFDALPWSGGAEVAALAKSAGLSVVDVMPILASLELDGRATRGERGWRKARRG